MPSKDYARETAEAIEASVHRVDITEGTVTDWLTDIIQRLAVVPARKEALQVSGEFDRMRMRAARRAGAEEMRERAASYCDDMRNGFIEMGDYEDQVADFTTARDDIRALPIDPPPEREPEEEKHGDR